MLVGEGMLRTVGTTARASKALAEANINIEIINQGSSEVSLMFGIDEKDADEAVRSLYNEFFPHG
jgi:aspartate kinase